MNMKPRCIYCEQNDEINPCSRTGESINNICPKCKLVFLNKLLDGRRITPETRSTFNIHPSGNGWKYPVIGGGYRWKNADSSAMDKYRWCSSKPKAAYFYHAKDLKNAVEKADGACWFVSGEADTWALYSAGIRNVLSCYSENHIPGNFVEYLAGIEVKTLYIAPDLDATGIRWAQSIAHTIQNSMIKLEARKLPSGLGAKGDLGKAWQTYSGLQTLEQYLFDLPLYVPLLPVEDNKNMSPRLTTRFYPGIPQVYKDQIATKLMVSGYKRSGFSLKNVNCPFHNDRHPSASLHREKGLYCHVCGRWYTWNMVGENLGLNSILNQENVEISQLSTELRECLIRNGKTSLARFLEVAYRAGWKAGKVFSRKQALEIAKGSLGVWTIRKATEELEAFCGFIPSFLLQQSNHEKNHKNSRPPKLFRLPDPTEFSRQFNITPRHFDEIDCSLVIHAADYKAAIYAALPIRKPGIYPRKKLVERVGVTNRTGQSYDKRAGLIVTRNLSRSVMSSQECASLPLEISKKRRCYSWLEDDRGKKYPPLKNSLLQIRRNGGGIVYLVKQMANTYQPGVITKKIQRNKNEQ